MHPIGYGRLKSVRARIFCGLWLLPAMPYLTGCSCRLQVPAAQGLLQTKESVELGNNSLEVHLFKPLQPGPHDMLIIYATGDGGWIGFGKQVFDWLNQCGYPVVGFSSKAYLRTLKRTSDTGTTTPRRLARDYQKIIEFSGRRLGLPESTPVILVGLSRGAGFSVVAAGEGELDRRLAGLLTIALTKEEEYVLHRVRRPGSRVRPRVEIQTYRYLNRIASFPVAVLQSTHDKYLSADDARRLFGPDTELRRLRPIEAESHSFRNGCGTLYSEIHSTLAWIVSKSRH